MLVVPDIEDLVPLPASTAEAMPSLSPHQELEMRARTIKLISDLTGTPLAPTEDDQQVAAGLAQQMLQDPKSRPEFAKYPNEVMAYLAGMIQQSNVQLVDELSELKLYVVNKLIFEVENAKDSKSRISALSKLGEIDGVDAFKKRTAVEHTFKSAKEVEDELSRVLEGISYTVLPEISGELSDLTDESP